MLCHQCKKRAANVHVVQEVNNEKTEFFLCEQCANNNQKLHFNLSNGLCNLNINLGGLLPGFIVSEIKQDVARRKNKCENCSMSFEEFQRTGKLGCGNCYETFFNELAPIIARIHGNVENKGKMPHKITIKGKEEVQLEVLRKELKEAISVEEYEKAAKLRDLIREIELNN